MAVSGVLAGRVVIVTGSTRGIGRAIAESFATAGAKVTISSRKREACEETCRAMREAGHEVLSVPAHVDAARRLTGQLLVADGGGILLAG